MNSETKPKYEQNSEVTIDTRQLIRALDALPSDADSVRIRRQSGMAQVQTFDAAQSVMASSSIGLVGADPQSAAPAYDVDVAMIRAIADSTTSPYLAMHHDDEVVAIESDDQIVSSARSTEWVPVPVPERSAGRHTVTFDDVSEFCDLVDFRSNVTSLEFVLDDDRDELRVDGRTDGVVVESRSTDLEVKYPGKTLLTNRLLARAIQSLPESTSVILTTAPELPLHIHAPSPPMLHFAIAPRIRSTGYGGTD